MSSPVTGRRATAAPDFSHTSDHVAVGGGLYPVRYEGQIHSLRTERSSGGFNAAAWLVGLVARGLGLVLVVVGGLAGWRRSR